MYNPRLNLTYYFKNLLPLSLLPTPPFIRLTTDKLNTLCEFCAAPSSTSLPHYMHIHTHTLLNTCRLEVEGREWFLFITSCEHTQVQVKITLIRRHVSESMCTDRLIEGDILGVSIANQCKQIEEKETKNNREMGKVL